MVRFYKDISIPFTYTPEHLPISKKSIPATRSFISNQVAKGLMLKMV